MKRTFFRSLLATPVFLSIAISSAHATELTIVSSGGFMAASKANIAEFEHATGNTAKLQEGASMGATPTSIPNRLAQGQQPDVVIMVGYALDKLIKDGKVRPDSRVEIGDSRIGMVVKEGAPKPDIHTPAALRKTLLQAQSVAYSESASGVYLHEQLFKRLHVDKQMDKKATMITGVVGQAIADGKYQIGFQQVSELLPVRGTTFVGKIPESLQSVTRYAAGIPTNAPHPDVAKAYLAFVTAPAQAHDVVASGMDPIKVSAVSKTAHGH